VNGVGEEEEEEEEVVVRVDGLVWRMLAITLGLMMWIEVRYLMKAGVDISVACLISLLSTAIVLLYFQDIKRKWVWVERLTEKLKWSVLNLRGVPESVRSLHPVLVQELILLRCDTPTPHTIRLDR
jgi:hypothetical protein